MLVTGEGCWLSVIRCLLYAGWWTAGKQTAPCHLQPEKPLLPERSDAQNEVLHFPLGDTICLRQQAIIFACGADEDFPLNPLSLMNS